MLAAWLSLFLLAPAAEGAESPAPAPRVRAPYVLVLSDGSRLPLRDEPKWVFGRASVADAAGRRLELKWSQVDHEATRRANPRRAEEPDGLPEVWDEAALRRLQGRRLNVVDNGGPAGGSAQTAPASSTRAKAGASEADWRARAGDLRGRIARLEAELEYLDRVKSSWESFALGTGGDYNAAAASKLGEVRRARQSREEALGRARSEWEAAQDEARRSNVPPGWLR